ncbi:hypothetical protein FA95DRAFT_1457852, partial [Auriscalpium vulgare]
WPEWLPCHQVAFEHVKALVLSPECLTTIDHQNPGENTIWVTTYTSDFCTGTV